MALLIDIGQPNWIPDESLRDTLAPMLPGVTIHCGRPDAPLEDVVMLATSVLPADVLRYLPKLQLIQKLGAGVESILRNPDLSPDVRVARLALDGQAGEIAEFVLAYVLRGQRNMARHEAGQAACRWDPIAPRRADRTSVGVLGLGLMGARIARLFASLDFRVLGWSRSQKEIEGVDCRAGPEALPGLLSECDYVASILPATPQTRDLFDAALFAAMKPGAVLINVGRGDLIVEQALLEALDKGGLGGAVLDTHREEPLPADHPFWRHPKITVTPHVAGWRIDGGPEDVAENYRRLTQGRPLLHEVDRDAGY